MLPAGKLIDGANLKGKRTGGAEISFKHANFIVNRGNACSSDVLRLIRFIKETVYKQKEILLECEVIYLSPYGIKNID